MEIYKNYFHILYIIEKAITIHSDAISMIQILRSMLEFDLLFNIYSSILELISFLTDIQFCLYYFYLNTALLLRGSINRFLLTF
jgi:hypothetical protein